MLSLYAADTVATAVAAPARPTTGRWKPADSLHVVSDHMTQALGSTALEADQRMDESRLQLKLAAAEARQAADGFPTGRNWPPCCGTMRTPSAERPPRRRDPAAERAGGRQRCQAGRRGGAERAAEALQLEQLARSCAPAWPAGPLPAPGPVAVPPEAPPIRLSRRCSTAIKSGP